MVTTEKPITSIRPEISARRSPRSTAAFPPSAQKIDPKQFPVPLVRVVDDHLVALRSARHHPYTVFGSNQPFAITSCSRLLQDRPELLLHQPQIVGSRSRLQLPLVLEQRRLVDIPVQLVQVEVAPRAHAEEGRHGNLLHILHDLRAFRAHRRLRSQRSSAPGRLNSRPHGPFAAATSRRTLASSSVRSLIACRPANASSAEKTAELYSLRRSSSACCG